MTVNSSQPQAATLKVGDKLDKYTIVGQIGAGGASVVWQGHDPLLDQHVAIKQLVIDPTQVNDEALHDRFRNEAKLQKSLSDKHLVQVINLLDESRGLFIVMEYIDGLSLEQILAMSGQAMEYRRALGIVGATALGLEAIHQHQIVHRDLKPSNILLPHVGGLKITDFGLATLLAEQDALSLGSARYMAPELFSGDRVDARADMYSLGMIAYEMLAGRDAFSNVFKIVLRDERNQALRWMKWHTNPRTRPTPLHEVNAEIPKPLSDLVGRMMEKDLNQRVASGHQLIETIRRHFSGKGQIKEVHTRKPKRELPGDTAIDTTAPTAALPKRKRWPLVLAAVLGLAVLGTGGYFTNQWWQQKQSLEAHQKRGRDKYNQAKQLFQDEDYDAARSAFVTVINDWPDDQPMVNAAQAHILFCDAWQDYQQGRFDQALTRLDELDRNPIIQNNYPDRLYSLRKNVERRDVFLEKVASIQKLISNNQLAQARQMLRAEGERRMDRLPAETATLQELGQQIEAKREALFVQETLREVDALHQAGNIAQALRVLIDAQKRQPDQRLAQRQMQIQQDRDYVNLVNQAGQLEQQQNFARAIELYEQANQMRPNSQITQRIRQLKGSQAVAQARTLLAQGQTEQARQAFVQALSFGDFPEAKAALKNLESADQMQAFLRSGESALAAGDYSAAIQQFENAMELGAGREATDGRRRAQIELYLTMAQRQLAEGQIAEAQSNFEQVRQLDPNNNAARRGLAELDQYRLYAQHKLAGDRYKGEGKLGDAMREYSKAEKVLHTPQIALLLEETQHNILVATAKNYIAQEEWASAKSMLETARKQQDSEQIRQLLEQVNANLHASD